MDEVAFIQDLSITVANHGGRIREIDFEKGTFQVICPKKNEVACAIALNDVMDRYYPEEEDG